MNVFKRILDQKGASLVEAMIAATLIGAGAVVISYSMSKGRTDLVRIRDSGQCQSILKDIIDDIKSIDNANNTIQYVPQNFEAVSGSFGGTHIDSSLVNGFERYTSITDVASSFNDGNVTPVELEALRYGYPLVHNNNARLTTFSANEAYTAAEDTMVLVAPLPSNPTAADLQNRATAFNNIPQMVNTWQLISSAGTYLSYYYNQNNNAFCVNGAGNQVFPLANAGEDSIWSRRAAPYLAAGSNLTARIQRENLLTKNLDCLNPGQFRLLPAGRNSSSSFGLQLQLTLNYVDPNGNAKACSVSNSFSQNGNLTNPTVGVVSAQVFEAATNSPAAGQFCGSVDTLNPDYTPPIKVLFSSSNPSDTLICRLEFNRSFRDNVVSTGLQYADTGWFLCGMPPKNFTAGVDPSTIDPNDLLTTYANSNQRATIRFTDFSVNGNQYGFVLRDLPEGSFTYSVASVDTTQNISANMTNTYTPNGNISTNVFYVDLVRPFGIDTVNPMPINALNEMRVGEFDTGIRGSSVLDSLVVDASATNFGNLKSGLRTRFGYTGTGSGNLFQCEAGTVPFDADLSSFQEVYQITDPGVKWYFGPSSNALNTIKGYLDYDAAQIAAFNAANPNSKIIGCQNGITTGTSEVINASGEWMAVAGPCDLCGSSAVGYINPRYWIADLSGSAPDALIEGKTNAVSDGTLATKDRASFSFAVDTDNDDHNVGRYAGTKKLPTVLACEVADSSVPSATYNKSAFSYTFYDPGTQHTGVAPNITVGGVFGSNSCTQGNFSNSCIAGNSGAANVACSAAVDACGRLAKSEQRYEVRGISNGSTVHDNCANVNCAPGYYCDKSGTGIGTCKAASEIVWNTTHSTGTSCTGSSCSCGINNDCQNDMSSGMTCVGSALECGGGTLGTTSLSSNYPGPSSLTSMEASKHADKCLASSQRNALVSYPFTNTASITHGTTCNWASANGSSCTFNVSQVNSHVNNPYISQEQCTSTSNTYYDWGDQSESFNSAAACGAITTSSCNTVAPLNGSCSTAGAKYYCSGIVNNYSWTSVSNTQCPFGCAWQQTSTVDCRALGYATQFDCSSALGGPMGNCNLFTTYQRYISGWDVGVYSKVASSVRDCSSVSAVASLPTCNAGEVGNTYNVLDGSGGYDQYRCDVGCTAPTRVCEPANSMPPWTNDDNTVSLAFNNARCAKQMGSCQPILNNNMANAGTNSEYCPSICPFDDVAATCATNCSESPLPSILAGFHTSQTYNYSCGANNFSCSGSCNATCNSTETSFSGASSYANCVASGAAGCRLPCANYNNLTCGTVVSCPNTHTMYNDQASCQTSRSTSSCAAISTGPNTGKWCGNGCPGGLTTYNSLVSCEGGGTFACSLISPVSSPSQEYCRTTCDSANEDTFANLASCIAAGYASADCTAGIRTVYNSAGNGSTASLYCPLKSSLPVLCDATEYNTQANCESVNGVGSCKSISVAGLACNGSYTCNSTTATATDAAACSSKVSGDSCSFAATCAAGGCDCGYEEVQHDDCVGKGLLPECQNDYFRSTTLSPPPCNPANGPEVRVYDGGTQYKVYEVSYYASCSQTNYAWYFKPGSCDGRAPNVITIKDFPDTLDGQTTIGVVGICDSSKNGQVANAHCLNRGSGDGIDCELSPGYCNDTADLNGSGYELVCKNGGSGTTVTANGTCGNSGSTTKWVKDCDAGVCAVGERTYVSQAACEADATGCSQSTQTSSSLFWRPDAVPYTTPVPSGTCGIPNANVLGSVESCSYSDGPNTTTEQRNCQNVGSTSTCTYCYQSFAGLPPYPGFPTVGGYNKYDRFYTCDTLSSKLYCGTSSSTCDSFEYGYAVDSPVNLFAGIANSSGNRATDCIVTCKLAGYTYCGLMLTTNGGAEGFVCQGGNARSPREDGPYNFFGAEYLARHSATNLCTTPLTAKWDYIKSCDGVGNCTAGDCSNVLLTCNSSGKTTGITAGGSCTPTNVLEGGWIPAGSGGAVYLCNAIP